MADQNDLLDTATIRAAVAGEKWAAEKVIEHYAPFSDGLDVYKRQAHSCDLRQFFPGWISRQILFHIGNCFFQITDVLII